MKSPEDLAVKIFADGAQKKDMLHLYGNPWIKGFTTNPTLMRKAGVQNYEDFARDIIAAIPDLPISFEVFADDFAEMERQALYISSWGKNVYVKIPVTNTRGESSCPLIRRLSLKGVKINVTALLTLTQVQAAAKAMSEGPGGFISVFAGRIADTGRDPAPMMAEAVTLLKPWPFLELIWASPRELLNLFQANAVGCHAITMTVDLLKKLNCIGKSLEDFSLETVRMFREDALEAGFFLVDDAE